MTHDHWLDTPQQRDVFLEGYGRTPTEAEWRQATQIRITGEERRASDLQRKITRRAKHTSLVADMVAATSLDGVISSRGTR